MATVSSMASSRWSPSLRIWAMYMPPHAAETLAMSISSGVLAKLFGAYCRAVVTPRAPSSMAWRTRTRMA